MTHAICTVCGQYKFGALVQCERCGHLPATALEKAKAINLSDHNCDRETLDDFKKLLEAGNQLPYDPVSLAYSSAPFNEEAYFEENFNFDSELLPCRHCNVPFKPENEEIFCPRCVKDVDPVLAACITCLRVYDSQNNFCQKCGSRLVQHHMGGLTAGRELAVSVRRVLIKSDPLAQLEFLSEVRAQLPDDDLAASQRESENFAMYTAVMALRELEQCFSSNVLASNFVTHDRPP